MALSYKSRRRWALIILVIGLPIYILLAIAIMSRTVGQFPLLIELLIYIALGIGWTFPLKFVFMGVGQPDPDAKRFDDD